MPSRFLKPALAAFEPYTPGEQPPDAEGWVKLNTNESPWPPSPRVIEAVRAAAGDSLRLYPSPTAAPARAAVGRALGLDPAMVCMVNGGDELIAMAVRAFAGAGDPVAWFWPTYPYYEPQVRMHEAVPRVHQLVPGGRLPPAFVEDDAPLKFFCNPNSPTGAFHGRDAVEEVVTRARGVVLLDEAYVDFAPENRQDLLAHHPNLVILRTLSKSSALAGMRIGYGLAQPETIAALDLVRDSYNLDRLAIVAAVAAMEDTEHRTGLVEHVLDERRWLGERLAERGFVVDPSATNFLFVRPPAPAGELYRQLRERKVLVRYYDRPPIDGHFRVTVGTRAQHQALLDALQEILG